MLLLCSNVITFMVGRASAVKTLSFIFVHVFSPSLHGSEKKLKIGQSVIIWRRGRLNLKKADIRV